MSTLEKDLSTFFDRLSSEIQTQGQLSYVAELLTNTIRGVRGKISPETEIALTHALLDADFITPIKTDE